MDDLKEFERYLKSLPLRNPSPQLRRRIFGRPPLSTRLVSLFQRPVRLGWAAMFSLALGFGGFSLDRVVDATTSKPIAKKYVEVEVHLVSVPSEPSDRHDFDLSTRSNGFLGGEVSFEVEKRKEL